MLRPILILLAGIAVTGAVFWSAVHSFRKVLHIKESGLDPGASAPGAGSPYAAAEARRALGARAVILGGIGTILALLATW